MLSEQLHSLTGCSASWHALYQAFCYGTDAELHADKYEQAKVLLQEQLRAEKLLAEKKQLTFRPSINHYYHTSRPQLRLSNPEPYLAHVQARALKRRESLLRTRAAAEVRPSACVDHFEATHSQHRDC